MLVNDTIIAFVFLLEGQEIAQSAEVISKSQFPTWLDTRKNNCHDGLLYKLKCTASDLLEV
jgi:hypothetical protein